MRTIEKYLAFDIGGTDIKYAVLEKEGNFLQKGSYPSNRFDGSAILQSIIDRALQTEGLTGIALSVPGFVDQKTGYIEVGGAIGDFNRFNIKEYLEEQLNISVSAENDVNCVALGEKWKGNAQNEADFLCMTIGTGIGGAIFIDNKLYRGSSNMAGEFGYMITQGLQNNLAGKCTLSYTGSIYGLRERFAKYKGVKVETVSGFDVFDACEQGDPRARHEVTSFYNSLAIAVYNLLFMFNPKKLFIGGAVSERKELISELTWRIQSMGSYGKESALERCGLKNDAGLLGALYHHLQACASKI